MGRFRRKGENVPVHDAGVQPMTSDLDLGKNQEGSEVARKMSGKRRREKEKEKKRQRNTKAKVKGESRKGRKWEWTRWICKWGIMEVLYYVRVHYYIRSFLALQDFLYITFG